MNPPRSSSARRKLNGSRAAVLTALLGCAACSSVAQRPAPLPAVAIAPQAVPRPKSSGPFLYVAGLKLAMYALGSSTPLHVANVNPSTVGYPVIALDLHGHLCDANGEVSYPDLLEYDAATLKFKKGVAGAGGFPALVADHLGYLYASTFGGAIEVYAPGCLRRVNIITRGVDVVGALVFDQSGNLYAAMSPHYAVSVYAPTERPGHMKFVRKIRDGISDPGPLAIGPSGDLFVANFRYSKNNSYITVYPPGRSKPVLRITKGMKYVDSLAVDSTGRLYVAVPDYEVHHGGWISVYAAGGTQLVRKVPVRNPVALALDSSDNLYVVNFALHSSVLVYSPGATKLLRTITEGLDAPSALLIGSP
jgi:hypothetical protein